MMDSSNKTVLLVQPSQQQGQIWQAALLSQGISVLWESGKIDLKQTLEQTKAAGLPLPTLVLVEIESLSDSPYAFCQWSREAYPDLAIVLLSAKQREISPVEHHWATFRGALDLLPGFYADDLLTGVTRAIVRVLALLDWEPINQRSLLQALTKLANDRKSARTAGGTRPLKPAATQPTPPQNFPPPQTSDWDLLQTLSRPPAPPTPAPAAGHEKSLSTPYSVANLTPGTGIPSASPLPLSSLETPPPEEKADRPQRRYRGAVY